MKKRAETFTDLYGHARLPVFARSGEDLWVTVGNQIFKKTQEGPYGFMNVIHDYALHFLGVPFLEQEEAKPFERRHPAIKWLHVTVDEDAERRAKEGKSLKGGQHGAGAAWFRFAYDMFTIKDNGALQERLRTRLLDSVEFQSARHELKIAAMAIGAGFTLAFENELDNTSTHFEFVGTHITGLKIAVEAKSRRRRGVHGFEGGAHRAPGSKVDIRSLVTDAYRKVATIPFYVFVDVNLPPYESHEQYEGWLMEIQQTMQDLAVEGYADPNPANVVFFMNDPSHYLGAEAIGNDNDVLWWKHFKAVNPRIPHPEIDVVEIFDKAIRQRAVPPATFLDPLLAVGLSG
jgi:hypothetical protein